MSEAVSDLDLEDMYLENRFSQEAHLAFYHFSDMSDSNDPPSFDVYTYEGSPAVKVSHGYLMIALGFGLFYCINLILKRIGPPAKVTGDEWRWRNTLVSCIHSSLCGSAVLYW